MRSILINTLIIMIFLFPQSFILHAEDSIHAVSVNGLYLKPLTEYNMTLLNNIIHKYIDNKITLDEKGYNEHRSSIHNIYVEYVYELKSNNVFLFKCIIDMQTNRIFFFTSNNIDNGVYYINISDRDDIKTLSSIYKNDFINHATDYQYRIFNENTDCFFYTIKLNHNGEIESSFCPKNSNNTGIAVCKNEKARILTKDDLKSLRQIFTNHKVIFTTKTFSDENIKAFQDKLSNRQIYIPHYKIYISYLNKYTFSFYTTSNFDSITIIDEQLKLDSFISGNLQSNRKVITGLSEDEKIILRKIFGLN